MIKRAKKCEIKRCVTTVTRLGAFRGDFMVGCKGFGGDKSLNLDFE